MKPTAPPAIPSLPQRFIAPSSLLCALAFAIGPLLAALGFISEAAADTVGHVAIAFGILLLVFRVIGKRELGRLSPFEFVTLMLVPEIVSQMVQGSGDMSASLIGLSMLFFLVTVTSILSHRFPKFQFVVESPPTVLVANGEVLSEQMNQERISPEELASEMHKQGIEDLSQVKWAILESGGNITFVPFTGPTPPQVSD